MVTLVNRAKVITTTTGTGTLTLGSAVDGFQTFAAAGVTDGQTVRYAIENGTAWEIGSGTYTASGTTLSRSASESSDGGAEINLVGTSVVYVIAGAQDILQESDLTAGTGISIAGSTITNTAPDQTVSLTQGANVTITGTYPSFTIAATDTNTTYSAGTGLDLSGTTFSIDSTVATLTGSQTLTNKTLTTPAISTPTFTGTPIEDVYAISGTSVTLEPDNGSVQTHTLSGTTTYADGFSSGQAMTLMITDGGNSITWPTMTWVNNGGSVPDLSTPTLTIVTLWKVDTALYGALVGDGS